MPVPANNSNPFALDFLTTSAHLTLSFFTHAAKLLQRAADGLGFR
jgi:hypothetical protein